MQRELACAFPYMLWSSIYGAWGAESGHRDAFEALLGTLARRAANTPFEERSVCPAKEEVRGPVDVLTPHLSGLARVKR
jgi:hypothetical protein